MKEEEMSSEGLSEAIKDDRTDPGASRHGNFMNYYQFHPAEERVRQLPHGVWRTSHPDRKYVGLDVGCNAGDLTYELCKFVEKETIEGETEVWLLGVDLDPILIERACERNPRPRTISFQSLDFLSQNCDDHLRQYLNSLHRSRFDVVFCFSITMWIHLNHGDEGLIKFLEKVCELSEMVVIEPQLWKCYRSASRRLRRAKGEDFSLLNTLKYTGDLSIHINNILTNVCHFHKISETSANEWGRKLLIYSRKER